MIAMQGRMNLPSSAVVLLLTICSLAPIPALAADLTGKWAWTVNAGGTEIQRQAEFKQDGEKLTGKVSGTLLAAPVVLRDGAVKGDQVSFTMVVDRDGTQLSVRYEGKIVGDAIKGTLSVNIQGENQTLEWNAKRVKAVNVAGKWTSTVRADNAEHTLAFELKQDGEKVSGTVSGGDQSLEIREGKLSGQDVSFVVVRNRNGQDERVSFKGQVDGDTIKGKITGTVGGQQRDLDWLAKRN